MRRAGAEAALRAEALAAASLAITLSLPEAAVVLAVMDDIGPLIRRGSSVRDVPTANTVIVCGPGAGHTARIANAMHCAARRHCHRPAVN